MDFDSAVGTQPLLQAVPSGRGWSTTACTSFRGYIFVSAGQTLTSAHAHTHKHTRTHTHLPSAHNTHTYTRRPAIHRYGGRGNAIAVVYSALETSTFHTSFGFHPSVSFASETFARSRCKPFIGSYQNNIVILFQSRRRHSRRYGVFFTEPPRHSIFLFSTTLPTDLTRTRELSTFKKTKVMFYTQRILYY